MLAIPVIHPGIRLTWIRKHWGPEFVNTWFSPIEFDQNGLIFVQQAPDNPTNHLLLEVELHMRSSSNKRELNVYGPPPINLE
ncbi:hypothetical protein L208DRAFT_1418324 [Tricholoma matsutake]|nr:hypothetical protein L208DRAFT_1418324 [Tricholoma matsutake 945]